LAEDYLIVYDLKGFFSNESVVNNIKNLRIQGISDEENLNVSVIPMRLVNSISGNDSQNVEDPVEGVFNDLNVPLAHMVVVHKGISSLASEDFLSCGQINIQEVIFDQFTHFHSTAVDHCESVVSGENLIDVVTVKIGNVFNGDNLVDSYARVVVVGTDDQLRHVTVDDQTKKPAVGFDFGSGEIKVLREVGFVDLILWHNVDVVLDRTVYVKIVPFVMHKKYHRKCPPNQTSLWS
jgi:hypothetical protein